MRNLVEIAHDKAQAILSTECSPIGLMASPEGYPHVGDYCDVFGNLLAILFDVANPAQEKRILDYLYNGNSMNGAIAGPAGRWVIHTRPGQPGCTCMATAVSSMVGWCCSVKVRQTVIRATN